MLVLLTHVPPNDCAYHQVYCFDRITGTRLTNAQILDLCGVTRANQGGAADAAERCFHPSIRTPWATMRSGRSSSNGRAAPKMSDMMMYPDENGKLMLLSPSAP